MINLLCNYWCRFITADNLFAFPVRRGFILKAFSSEVDLTPFLPSLAGFHMARWSLWRSFSHFRSPI